MAEKDEGTPPADTGSTSSPGPALVGAAIIGGLIGLAVYAALLVGIYFGLGIATRFPQN